MNQSKKKILWMTQFSILMAIEMVFCFTPLGSLPITPTIVATLSMVPVCIAAILLGTKAGSAMGLIAAVCSLLVWTFMPPNPVTAFAFTPFYSLGEFRGNFGSLLICFVPRILTGTVTGLIHSALGKRNPKGETLGYALSSAVGSMVNTLGVVGGIWLFFGGQYERIFQKGILALVGITITANGVPEAIVAALASVMICKPVGMMMRRAEKR